MSRQTKSHATGKPLCHGSDGKGDCNLKLSFAGITCCTLICHRARNFPPKSHIQRIFIWSCERNCSFYCWQFIVIDWTKTFRNGDSGENTDKSMKQIWTNLVMKQIGFFLANICANCYQAKLVAKSRSLLTKLLCTLLSNFRQYRCIAFRPLLKEIII